MSFQPIEDNSQPNNLVCTWDDFEERPKVRSRLHGTKLHTCGEASRSDPLRETDEPRASTPDKSPRFTCSFVLRVGIRDPPDIHHRSLNLDGTFLVVVMYIIHGPWSGPLSDSG